MSEKKKFSLTTKIFIGLILGAITGVLLYPVREVPMVNNVIIGFGFELLGSVFMRAIRMMVVPLVFVSLVLGAANAGDIKRLGRIGSKTLFFYLTTTACAITIAIGLANIINPGRGMDMSMMKDVTFTGKEAVPFVQVLLNMVPKNPVAALTSGNMLQIIVFSLLCGAALTVLGDKASKLKDVLGELNEMVLKMIEMIMYIAPFGVFGLIAKTFSNLGYDAIKPLMAYFFTVLLALVVHAIVTYNGFLVAFTKINPISFFKKMVPALSVAFSTSSSATTLPVTMEVVEEEFGVKNSVCSFTLPLGVTINMDGTAIMQGVATVFIAQIYGVQLGIPEYISVIITATIASVGTAGVPGVGLIMLSMVLTQVGLPVEGIGLIMGVDRLLDMSRTAINICGDAACTLIVATYEDGFHTEEELRELKAKKA